MIFGTHLVLYSTDPEADRTFFRDVLGLRHVDVGHGWLIFKLPPTEAAVHPVDGDGEVGDSAQVQAGHRLLGAELFLMCDDLAAQAAMFKSKGIQCGKIDQAGWGIKTTIKLPSGGDIGLYQPKHATALDL